jgi:hypothetical protein
MVRLQLLVQKLQICPGLVSQANFSMASRPMKLDLGEVAVLMWG